MQSEASIVRILPERSTLASRQKSEVDLVIDIVTGDKKKKDNTSNALNMFLCITIDVSGSMSGEKLESAKSVAVELLNRLSPQDAFCMIAFDHAARIVAGANMARRPESLLVNVTLSVAFWAGSRRTRRTETG
jgi:secreted protein with Ig-like and vWFA domain